MQVLVDNIGSIISSLVVSGVMVVGSGYVNSSVSQELLTRNIKATEDLSHSVRALEISVAVFAERYPTRVELESKLKEASKNGS